MIDLVEHETLLCIANSCKQQRFAVQTVQTFTVQTGAESHARNKLMDCWL